MTEVITNENSFKNESISQLSIQSLKEEVFNELTPLEMMITLNKMQEQLLCSHETDGDNVYRTEIVFLCKAVTKMILALKNDLNPKSIHVLEMVFE